MDTVCYVKKNPGDSFPHCDYDQCIMEEETGFLQRDHLMTPIQCLRPNQTKLLMKKKLEKFNLPPANTACEIQKRMKKHNEQVAQKATDTFWDPNRYQRFDFREGVREQITFSNFPILLFSYGYNVARCMWIKADTKVSEALDYCAKIFDVVKLDAGG